jgi:putative sterol carrier protein
MTWQGGKKAPDTAPATQFARLKPLAANQQNDVSESLQSLAQALNGYASPVRLHIRLTDGENFDHWEVEGGSRAPSARRNSPKDADVHLVMRHETWVEIANGNLAPFDALFAGKMRVGGNLELAKNITRHLSDPAVPFVAPCAE